MFRFAPLLTLIGLLTGCAQAPETGSASNALTVASVSRDAVFHRAIFEGTYDGEDGEPIRFRASVPRRTEAVVLFIHGRGEFLEKYDALFTSLHEYPVDTVSDAETLADMRRVAFVALETAGQGLSVDGRIPGHVESYDALVENIRLAFDEVSGCARITDRPVIVMAHSMGGLVAARFAQTYPEMVDSLVLSSPMFGIQAPPGVTDEQVAALAYAYALPAPYGFGFADRCAISEEAPLTTLGELAYCLSDATCGACFADPTQAGCEYIPLDWAALHSAWAYLNSPESIGCAPVHAPELECDPTSPYFNGLTTDVAYCQYFTGHGNAIGGPTFGWLLESLRGIDAMNAELANLTQPVVIFSTPIDPIVKASEHVRICDALTDCTLVVKAPTASGIFLHELLAETQRAEVIEAIQSFIASRI